MTHAAAVDWIEKTPRRWARNGATIGLIWVDSAPALEDMIVYVAALPIGGALVGGFVGVITADQIRKRLARNAN
jgi:hypothetical protein